jgi:hypothetical protein
MIAMNKNMNTMNKTNMSRIERIAEAHLSGVVAAYQGETREWWNDFDEESIYREIANPKFDEFVRRVEEDATNPNHHDAA